MSLSIYYTARRASPLSPSEQAAVAALIEAYSIRDQVNRYVQTGRGHDGEDVVVFDPLRPSRPNVVFEGETKLPGTDEDALWALVQRWCALLSEVRRAISAATWHVHVDDHDVCWDEAREMYNPAS